MYMYVQFSSASIIITPSDGSQFTVFGYLIFKLKYIYVSLLCQQVKMAPLNIHIEIEFSPCLENLGEHLCTFVYTARTVL